MDLSPVTSQEWSICCVELGPAKWLKELVGFLLQSSDFMTSILCFMIINPNLQNIVFSPALFFLLNQADSACVLHTIHPANPCVSFMYGITIICLHHKLATHSLMMCFCQTKHPKVYKSALPLPLSPPIPPTHTHICLQDVYPKGAIRSWALAFFCWVRRESLSRRSCPLVIKAQAWFASKWCACCLSILVLTWLSLPQPSLNALQMSA